MSSNPPFPPQGLKAGELPHPSGISADHRSWAMLCHLAAFANLLVPFGSVIGPLVAWLIKREESDFVDRAGKEAIQFQASFLAYNMVLMCGGIGSFVGLLLAAEAGGPKGAMDVVGPIGMVALFGLFGLALLMRLFVCVTSIVAGVKANNGEEFRYPLTIRVMRTD